MYVRMYVMQGIPCRYVAEDVANSYICSYSTVQYVPSLVTTPSDECGVAMVRRTWASPCKSVWAF